MAQLRFFKIHAALYAQRRFVQSPHVVVMTSLGPDDLWGELHAVTIRAVVSSEILKYWSSDMSRPKHLEKRLEANKTWKHGNMAMHYSQATSLQTYSQNASVSVPNHDFFADSIRRYVCMSPWVAESFHFLVQTAEPGCPACGKGFPWA